MSLLLEIFKSLELKSKDNYCVGIYASIIVLSKQHLPPMKCSPLLFSAVTMKIAWVRWINFNCDKGQRRANEMIARQSSGEAPLVS